MRDNRQEAYQCKLKPAVQPSFQIKQVVEQYDREPSLVRACSPRSVVTTSRVRAFVRKQKAAWIGAGLSQSQAFDPASFFTCRLLLGILLGIQNRISN